MPPAVCEKVTDAYFFLGHASSLRYTISVPLRTSINAHLGCHDTYRSWFEHTATNYFMWRMISNPSDLQFVPIRHD